MEFRDWNIATPGNVDEFQRQTQGAEAKFPGTTYRDYGAPPFCEAERETFIEKARERAARGEFRIRSIRQERTGMGPGEGGWAEYRQSDAEDPAPRALLRPIFSYMEWSSRTPEEDEWTSRWAKGETRRRMVCPDPDCIQEREEQERRGMVVLTGEEGLIALIAAPCSQHQGTFAFDPGWYGRFTLAYYRQDEEANGLPEPRHCAQCGHRYTSYLWGYPQDRCPPCTYREIRARELFDRYTITMERGRRHGLGGGAQGPVETEALLDFIALADGERQRKGLNPNAFINLEEEYQHQRARRRDGTQRGWTDPYARMTDLPADPWRETA